MNLIFQDLESALQHFTSQDMGSQMSLVMHSIFTRFNRLPLISVAAIEGYALGGGAELTSWCDHRIASRDATIRFVQVKMGVTPGWAGGYRVTEILGRSKAIKAFAGTLPISGQQGMDLGYIDELVDAGTAQARATQLLQEYLEASEGSKDALRGIKKVVTNVTDRDMDESLAREREIFSQLWGGKDNLAALARFKK